MAKIKLTERGLRKIISSIISETTNVNMDVVNDMVGNTIRSATVKKQNIQGENVDVMVITFDDGQAIEIRSAYFPANKESGLEVDYVGNIGFGGQDVDDVDDDRNVAPFRNRAL
jgi:hypothetical protein